ncbi:hypothetical protein [Streptomyces natalensis]|uniref:hypothetical protein n=1 Tax=Streptomyces natalensis TaxID=68242 RepID=UPI000AE3AE61|nr:hypothetical protein [Streptomyces natalensis]
MWPLRPPPGGPQDLVGPFDVTRWDPDQVLDPSWNVTPTNDVWSVLERVEHDTGEITRQLRPLRWELLYQEEGSPPTGVRGQGAGHN